MTPIAPAFRDHGQPPEPWTPETCDLIRDRMMRDIPGLLRKSAGRWPNQKSNEFGLDDLMPAVHGMRQQGLPWLDISRTLRRDVSRLRSTYAAWVIAHA